MATSGPSARAVASWFRERLRISFAIGRTVNTHDDIFERLAYIDALTRPNDRDNPGIIPDLRISLTTLFAAQNQSRTYISLMNKLDEYEVLSDELVNSKGGVDTEEEFAQYNKCANDLLNTLGDYVPKLLSKEDFFKGAFA